jgi:NAD+ kinase
VKNIAIFCKQKPSVDREVLSQLTRWLRERGINVLMDGDTAGLIDETSPLSRAELPRKVELIVVLGGDGTLLSVARIAHEADVPILGVNLGSLGFLTEITLDELYDTLMSVLDNKYDFEQRMLLSANLMRNGECIEDHQVLNDVVINKGALARIVNLKVRVDGQYMTSYRADGLIIATPTGSTAYSLSAGGPIIHPSMHALVLCPICPFDLANRPIVVPDQSVLEVEITTPNEDVRVTLDGQEGYEFSAGDVLRVKKADNSVKLVQAKGKNYYQLLRKKLHWGGSENPGGDVPA